MLAAADKVAAGRFVLAEELMKRQQTWRVLPGTQARALGSDTYGSAAPPTVPSVQRESPAPCLVPHPVPVVQGPFRRRPRLLVPTESPLWPPSPLRALLPVEEEAHRAIARGTTGNTARKQ